MRNLTLCLLTLPLALSVSLSAAVRAQPETATAQSDAAAAPEAAAPSDPAAEGARIEFGGPEPVVILSGETRHTISAEIATTPDQMQRGLMWRDSLGADAGMLFRYTPPRPTAMWMQNTLIPLDLVFIRPDGTIAKIIAFAQPGSERSLASDAIVAGVLELPAGRSLELGITPGDRVEHRFFTAARAPEPVADPLPATEAAAEPEGGEDAPTAPDAEAGEE